MQLPRRMSMSRRHEFAAVRKEGHSTACRYFLMATLLDPAIKDLKIGLITSRRVGNAVTRNKIRRRLRSIISKHGEKLQMGRYLVMVARHRAGEASFLQLEADWLRLAKRLGILRDPS